MAPSQSTPQIVSLYTDGACSGNPGPGGWGAVAYFDDQSCHEIGGADRQTTNNRMELQAAIAALELLDTFPHPQPITIHSDSKYVIDGITKWIRGWKRKGWKTSTGKAVLNQDLWQALDQVNQSWVSWRYVKGHSGDRGNDRIRGGGGQDTLTGGQGRDIFIFARPNEIGYTITDFELTKDRIKLRRLNNGIDAFSDLSIVQSGEDELVQSQSGDLIIRLNTIEAADLNSSHFIF